jgi:hypothetical protein
MVFAPSQYSGYLSGGKLLTTPGISATLWENPQDKPLTGDKTMKKQVVRISILQSSKIMTALYVLMGLIYTLISIPMMIFGSGPIRVMGMVYFFMPVLMGIFGFIFFVIFAAIYNLLAGWLGGVEVEVKDAEGV